MARIRTIKPEFWDSPSTAEAGPWARLAFIALWNWADDYGRGTANLKELEGFIFPNDDTFTDRSGNTVQFREVVAEVSEAFGVVFYNHDGRQFYAIPSWDAHQRNERRAKESRYPAPPENLPVTSGNAEGAEMHGISATEERKITDAPNISGPGTGEQGNRGTGEKDSPSELRPDVREILDALDANITDASVMKVPARTKKNLDAARLLLDSDGRDRDEILAVIQFATHDEFWSSNIGSMSKLREKYPQLKARMIQKGPRHLSAVEAVADRRYQENPYTDRARMAADQGVPECWL